MGMDLLQTTVKPVENGSWVEITYGDPNAPLGTVENFRLAVMVEHLTDGRLLLPELQKVALQRVADAISQQIWAIDQSLSP